MYKFGLSKLKEIGVEQCTLEVIKENLRAIKVYERIGFKIDHTLRSFKGEIETELECNIQQIEMKSEVFDPFQHKYSWDNSFRSIAQDSSPFKAYKLKTKSKKLSYFIINPTNGFIAQLEVHDDQWDHLFNGVSKISSSIKINNILASRNGLLNYLESKNITNSVNQYEMSMEIN